MKYKIIVDNEVHFLDYAVSISISKIIHILTTLYTCKTIFNKL